MNVLPLSRFFEHVPTSQIATLFVVSMAPTYLLMLVQAAFNRKLRNSAARGGIVSLEMAPTAGRARAIIDSWDDQARSSAKLGLWLDYIYLVSYAATLVLGCIWAARQLGNGSSWLEQAGGTLAGLVILAAAFDALEDCALLVQLYWKPRTPWAALSLLCASAKFLLLVLALAYVLAGVAAWVAIEPIGRSQIVVAVVASGGLIRAYLGCVPALVDFAFRHAALVAVVVLVYAMVYGQFGANYGIVSLFWNDRASTRISASLGVTLLLADLGIVVYFAAPELVAAVVGRPPWNGAPRTVANNLVYLIRFLMVGGFPLVVLLLAPAVLPAAFPSVPRSSSALAGGAAAYGLDVLIWASGIALGAIVPLVLIILFWVVYKKWVPQGDEMRDDVRISIAIFYAMFIGLYVVFAGPLYRSASPAFAICVLLGCLLMTYALPQYFITRISPSLRRWAVPPGAILVGLLLFLFGLANNDPYKLRFPNMNDYYPRGSRGIVNLRRAVNDQYAGERKPLPTGGASLIADSKALESWLTVVKSAAPAPGSSVKPKLVIVAISGGAARSAFWSAVVLDRLEAEIAGFGKHVRIITGASGGMVGAAYYIKDRKDLVSSPGRPATPLAPSIPFDSITPVAAHIALRDVWQAFLPWPFATDRGVVLERDWTAIDFPIQNLRPLEERGEIPSIILSPMIVEDGRRLLISNLDLWKITSAAGGVITGDDPGSKLEIYSLSAIEFFRLFPFAREFHLATGVRMSASFPYVSPAVNLPTNPPRRVVDAGYYDNYGIQLAVAWVQANFDWLLHETSGVVLVQIRDAVSELDRLDVASAPSGFWATLSRSFQFLSSPPDALQQARTSSGLFRNDEDVQTLSDLFTDNVRRWASDNIKDQTQRQQAVDRSRSFFTTVVFENSAEVSHVSLDSNAQPDDAWRSARHSSEVALDWYLSRAEQDALRSAILTPPASMPPVAQADHIRGLAAKVARSHGPMRTHWQNQLRTALNYAQLAQLRQWWDQPGPLP
jgi:hypothetical protein